VHAERVINRPVIANCANGKFNLKNILLTTIIVSICIATVLFLSALAFFS